MDEREAGGKGRIDRALGVLVWVYLALLAAVALALVLVGEDWWGGIILLYMPRLPLALPLLLGLPLLRRRGPRRLFLVQAAVAAAVVLLLAGPHLHPLKPASRGPSLRVLSYNVWYGKRGPDVIAREVEAYEAGIILFQAMRTTVADEAKRRWGDRYTFRIDTEFLLASRYPIVDSIPRVEGMPFAGYTLDTPLGLVDVFNVHPLSPRPGLDEVRHQSKRRLLADGPSDESVETVELNSDRREREVRALAEAVSRATHPVIVAGDTNLPERSRIFQRHLSGLQDGFAEVGTGFGYTFPANKLRPWMRIDRVLAGPALRFTSFAVGSREGSDHCAVIADLEPR